jgi:hypothetical protein
MWRKEPERMMFTGTPGKPNRARFLESNRIKALDLLLEGS